MIPLYQELPFTSNSYINFYKEDLPHFIVPWHYHPEIEIMYILGLLHKYTIELISIFI